MIKPEQLPEAALNDFYTELNRSDYPQALAAFLNAWPGMQTRGAATDKVFPLTLILPLPQEQTDDQ